MSYCVYHKGNFVDLKFKKLQGTWHQAVFVDDILLGQVFNMGKSWSIVSDKVIGQVSPMHGFKNKRFALDYLTKLNGYN